MASPVRATAATAAHSTPGQGTWQFLQPCTCLAHAGTCRCCCCCCHAKAVCTHDPSGDPPPAVVRCVGGWSFIRTGWSFEPGRPTPSPACRCTTPHDTTTYSCTCLSCTLRSGCGSVSPAESNTACDQLRQLQRVWHAGRAASRCRLAGRDRPSCWRCPHPPPHQTMQSSLPAVSSPNAEAASPPCRREGLPAAAPAPPGPGSPGRPTAAAGLRRPVQAARWQVTPALEQICSCLDLACICLAVPASGCTRTSLAPYSRGAAQRWG